MQFLILIISLLSSTFHFYSCLLIFCPLYQPIFADLDLECQNVADSSDESDPDPEQAASKDTDTDCFYSCLS